MTNNFNVRKQNKHKGSYYNRASVDFKNVEINLKLKFNELDRFIRATNFKDFQFATFNGIPIIGITRHSKEKNNSLLKNMIIYDKCQDSDIILWKDCANDIIKFAQQDDI